MRTLACFLALSIACGIAIQAGEAPGTDWMRQVTSSIEEAEYEVTWQPTAFAGLEAAWHAPNRAHGLRTYFTETGPRVVPRIASEPTWEWALALIGYGRGGALLPVAAPRLRASGGRIDYERGQITEWYENTPRGLEQGFVLWTRPEGEGAPIHLDLRLGGTLQPAISEDGQAVDFSTGGGVNVLHYSELVVTDAGGRQLPAWLEGFSGEGFGGLRIVVDDTGAAYPVTVDPLATTAAWTREGNQLAAGFAWSVATAGDVNGDGFSDVIVGAPFYDGGIPDSGRAYAYHGSASGLSTTAAWTVESDQSGSAFGWSVGTAGDVNGDGYSDVIVGDPYYDGAQPEQGRAFVFHGSALGLSGAAARTIVGKEFAYLGRSVATAGDVNGDGYSDVIVSASGEPRVYAFYGSLSGLGTTPAWSVGYESDVVATAGDVNGDGYSDVILGWWWFNSEEGRTDVFHGSPSGLLTAPAWTVHGTAPAGRFGFSVATAGDVNGDGYADVIAGAPYYANGQAGEGAAYVYHGSATGLSGTAAWTVESNLAGAELGYSVATAGDVNGDGYADVIAGARSLDNPENGEGGVYVYHGSASGLPVAANWTAESNLGGSVFGSSVSTAGDVNGDGYSDVIVGAPDLDNGQMNEGRAYVYHGSAAGLGVAVGWSTESNQSGAAMGYSVNTAGDVNGDGFADVIVGAPSYDNGEMYEGRAFVYHGSATGPSGAAAWMAEGNQLLASFGWSVSTAGDVNGDGYSDVIVGARNYTNDQLDEGRAFVYHGSPSGLAVTPAWTAEGDKESAHFGASVATAGDVNGDGRSDVIIGAFGYENDQVEEGRAYVYHGSVTGLRTTPAWTVEGNQLSAALGYSVATAGDVNRDGYSDVIVGSPAYDADQTDEGRALVYHGSPTGLSAAPAWTAESNQADSNFGATVASAGDVNGDGYSDVIVGASQYDNPEPSEGRAYVYLGSPSGLLMAAAWTAESNQGGASFGSSVASAGDVNGDGYSDVIVGASQYDNVQTNEGRAFVYHGSASGLATTAAWTAESDQVEAVFGSAVAPAGDVNGDGYAEVIVGAYGYEKSEADEGAAFLYYGNDKRGLALKPQQRRGNNTAPVEHLGASNAFDRFRLALLGRTPYGRGKVKLEWEVKPFNTLLNGTGISLGSTWMDTHVGGGSINQLVTGLTAVTKYHWRVRLRYQAATTPFQQRSRWLTVPRNGWQEQDLRTASAFAGSIGPTFSMSKVQQSSALSLSWEPSCADSDIDYAIYEGKIGTFPSHVARACSTNGAPSTTLTPGGESQYYLIVPVNGLREGSYGLSSSGQERPPAPGPDACLPQEIGACP